MVAADIKFPRPAKRYPPCNLVMTDNGRILSNLSKQEQPFTNFLAGEQIILKEKNSL